MSSSSIPFGNITALNGDPAPAWMPSARSRGTSDILYSCIVTLALCVYTAIHVNIPARGDSRLTQYLRKAGCTLVGIFAPEIMVWTAWDQYSKARTLCARLNALQKQKTPVIVDLEHQWDDDSSTSYTEQPRFDMTYAFYAVMGGFVVDVSSLHDGLRYMTLTEDDLEFLARSGYFFYVEESTIVDKSKADVLAKSLVCLQVTWMIVECIARKVAGYPLTILEIHTFVHVICALIIYGLWLQKPLNVSEATLIVLEGKESLRDIFALMLMGSTLNPARYEQELSFLERQFSIGQCELDILHYDSGTPDSPDTDYPPSHKRAMELGAYDQFRRTFPKTRPPLKRVLISGQSLHNFTVQHLPNTVQSSGEEGATFALLLSERDVRRWKHAGQAHEANADQVSAMTDGFSLRAKNFSMRFNDFSALLSPRNAADSSSASSISKRSLIVMVCLLALNASYGGIHMIAWADIFPTRHEHILWQISCIDLAVSGIMLAIFWRFMNSLTTYSSAHFERLNSDDSFKSQITSTEEETPDVLITQEQAEIRDQAQPLPPKTGEVPKSADGKKKFRFRLSWTGVKSFLLRIAVTLSYLFFILSVLAYVFARIFIVFESFLSLRKVPIGVYASVPWTSVIPHF